jgi:hypothetical protein
MLHRYLAPIAAVCIAMGCGSDSVDESDSALALSTTTYDFGAMAVGGHSPVLVITVSNAGTTTTGAIAVELDGPTSGDFSVSKDECTGVQLSSGSTCAIEVEVVPTALGLRQAVLTVSETGGDQVTATLSGTGSSSGLSLSPTVVTFGETAPGVPGVVKTVLVRNTATIATGALTVALTGGSASAFSITRDVCSATSLTQGASCAIDVRFVPASDGSHSATLSVTGVAAPSRSVQLLGLASGPTTLTATPPGAHTFAAQDVGTSSGGVTFVITNTGARQSGALAIQLSGANTADFQVASDGCYPYLPARADCSVTVIFSPLATGMRSTSVSVSDPLGSNVTISVSGEGRPAPPPPTPLTMTPSGSFSFAPTLVGASLSRTVTVTNPGSIATGLLSTSVLYCDDYYYPGCYPSASFSLENDTCTGAALPAGGSCTVSITFKPTYIGFDVAQFDVYAAGFTGTLALSGTGTGLHTSINGVNFAPTVVGTTSASQTVVITNTGSGSTGTLATEVSGFVFEIVSDTCAGASLPPGGFCTVAVRFKPTSPGGRYGALGISATPGGTMQIQLYGLGL